LIEETELQEFLRKAVAPRTGTQHDSKWKVWTDYQEKRKDSNVYLEGRPELDNVRTLCNFIRHLHEDSQRRYNDNVIQKILAGANPLQKIQNNNRIALACRIDDLMKANGYNNSTFAKKLGKQPSVITKWLSGTHNFTMDTLDEIAYHLGVESLHLFQPQQTQTIYQKTIQVVTKIAEEDLKYNCNSAENNASNPLNPNHGIGDAEDLLIDKSK
jgi:transcriptional regulator with XRE-family HTH domain